jgi:hypothetical protein
MAINWYTVMYMINPNRIDVYFYPNGTPEVTSVEEHDAYFEHNIANYMACRIIDPTIGPNYIYHRVSRELALKMGHDYANSAHMFIHMDERPPQGTAIPDPWVIRELTEEQLANVAGTSAPTANSLRRAKAYAETARAELQAERAESQAERAELQAERAYNDAVLAREEAERAYDDAVLAREEAEREYADVRASVRAARLAIPIERDFPETSVPPGGGKRTKRKRKSLRKKSRMFKKT